jgi:hypothetical protein
LRRQNAPLPTAGRDGNDLHLASITYSTNPTVKHFGLFAILAGAIGLSAAWAFNYSEHGHRDAYLDRLNMRDVSAENVLELVKADQQSSDARVELLTPEKHEFGVMSPGEKGEKAFRIKNVGTDVLTLKTGASTCKCTIGSLESNTLEPGEETEILISWTVKTDKNTFSQQAQVITNDPRHVVLNFEISGEVVRDIQFAPRDWLFGEVAAGESFEVKGKVFSFYKQDIEFVKARFVSEQISELADIEVTPFQPSEKDGELAKATQGFDIKAFVKPGLRQGAVSTRLLFEFHVPDELGNPVLDDESREPLLFGADVKVTGFISGQLSMVESNKIKSVDGGYIFNLGKITGDDSRKARGFIKLKGSQKDSTKLTIGEVSPAEAIEATLGKPINQGKTVLYPLQLEIIPGDKPIDLTGKAEGDYGKVWIESDNPKVPKMLIVVKFAIDSKP